MKTLSTPDPNRALLLGCVGDRPCDRRRDAFDAVREPGAGAGAAAFLSMLMAVPLLGERLDATTLIFALAVIAVVWIGKRMPVDQGYRAGTTKR